MILAGPYILYRERRKKVGRTVKRGGRRKETYEEEDPTGDGDGSENAGKSFLCCERDGGS